MLLKQKEFLFFDVRKIVTKIILKVKYFYLFFFTLFSGVFYFDFKKFTLLLTFSYDMSYNFN